ncbi:MAG: phosphonopyruvate decarboxylase [Pseudomonadota bacterium]
MLDPGFFYHSLVQSGIVWYAGIPDSLLKSFCAYVTDHTDQYNHTIAANEGAAVGLAMGYHLATGKVPLVYLQNSGLGNIVNPCLSLADQAVYAIPMIFLIGWRGEPGIQDEPQHIKQGRVTLTMLQAMGIPYHVIDRNTANVEQVIQAGVQTACEKSSPYAIVVRKGTFAHYTLQDTQAIESGFNRETAIREILRQSDPQDIIVSTTGMASRELFECRVASGQGHQQDFLTVGGMGHACQIALGIAGQKRERRIICLDGDGAALMHMGSMAICGISGLKNFIHIVINNGAHDSVGGQPTVGFDVCLKQVAAACGYLYTDCVADPAELHRAISRVLQTSGPAMLEIQVNKGYRKNLGRPTVCPKKNKERFMSFISKTESSVMPV